MGTNSSTPRDLFLGELRREYYLSDAGVQGEKPGGNLLYAAAGYLIWEHEYQPGLCTRVGNDFPQEWLELAAAHGINIQGVTFLPDPLDLRICYGWQENQLQRLSDPVSYCAEQEIPLPKALRDCRDREVWVPDRRARKPTSIREEDIPRGYVGATGAHLCHQDYLSHHLLPAVLRKRGFTTLTLDPAAEYMEPGFLGDIPALITGLTAFLPSDEELRALYKGQKADLWEIAEELSRYGCPIIVIKRGKAGQLVYDRESGRRWELPAYPSRVTNPIGAGDAFCGGFLAGYRRTFDPLQAALHGSIAASLVVEGSGPFYSLNTIPGLRNARREHLQSQVREI